MGIAILATWCGLTFKTAHRQDDLLLDFKDVTFATKIFILIALWFALWAIAINQLWQMVITPSALLTFVNDCWFAIGILCLSGTILLENLFQRPLFVVKSTILRRAIYIMMCVICILSFVYL